MSERPQLRALAERCGILASYGSDQVTELDRTGKIVWECKSVNVFRARRR